MKVKRDDGSEIDVEFEVGEEGSAGYSGYGNTSCDEAPSGSVVHLAEAEDAAGRDVLADLSDAERERIEQECAEAHDAEPYDPEPYD